MNQLYFELDDIINKENIESSTGTLDQLLMLGRFEDKALTIAKNTLTHLLVNHYDTLMWYHYLLAKEYRSREQLSDAIREINLSAEYAKHLSETNGLKPSDIYSNHLFLINSLTEQLRRIDT